MTQNTLSDEIEKELTTFSGQTFSNPEEVHKWLKGAFERIAEKAIEAMFNDHPLLSRVEEQGISHDNLKSKKAKEWLGE